MIASVRGRLRRKYEDRIVVEAAGVGYEVFIPPVVQRRSRTRKPVMATAPTRCC